MRFDVVIGNPPYQENDGGGVGSSARPIYNEFINKAIEIAQHTIMIIPARWYSGGKGLDSFRNLMLNTARIVELHDFEQATDIFENIRLPGGVCYFHIDNKHIGKDTKVVHNNNASMRPIKEVWSDIFIRDNIGVEVFKKVVPGSIGMDALVHERNPFGLSSDIFETKQSMIEVQTSEILDGLRIIGVVNNKREYRYVPKDCCLLKGGAVNWQVEGIYIEGNIPKDNRHSLKALLRLTK